MSRFLVTGGAGFIGSNFSKRALDLGYEVLILDNLSTGVRENIDSRSKFYEVDLCSYESIGKYFNEIEYVFHFAALPKVSLSVEKPRETNRNNVESTINILMASKEAGVKRVIYSASAAVYGNNAQSPQKEDMLANPASPYGIQKYVGELYVKNFYDIFGLEGVSLRYFNLYGPSMPFEGAYNSVIATFIKQKKEKVALTIFGDGEQTRDFIYVDDVIEANLKAAFSEMVGRGEVLNVGTGISSSVKRIAELMDGEEIYLEERKGDIKHSVADISKAQNLLGWEPKVSLEDGIKIIKEVYKL